MVDIEWGSVISARDVHDAKVSSSMIVNRGERVMWVKLEQQANACEPMLLAD